MDQLKAQTDCFKKVKNLGLLVIAGSVLTMFVGLGQTEVPRVAEMGTVFHATRTLLLFLGSGKNGDWDGTALQFG